MKLQSLPTEILLQIVKNLPPSQIPKTLYALKIRLNDEDYRYLGDEIFGSKLFNSTHQFLNKVGKSSNRESFLSLSLLSGSEDWYDLKFYLTDIFRIPQPDLNPFFNCHNFGPLFVLGRLWFRGYENPLLSHLLNLSISFAQNEGYFVEINEILNGEWFSRYLGEIHITFFLLLLFGRIIPKEVEFYFLDYDLEELQIIIDLIISQIQDEIKESVDLIEPYWK